MGLRRPYNACRATYSEAGFDIGVARAQLDEKGFCNQELSRVASGTCLEGSWGLPIRAMRQTRASECPRGGGERGLTRRKKNEQRECNPAAAFFFLIRITKLVGENLRLLCKCAQ